MPSARGWSPRSPIRSPRSRISAISTGRWGCRSATRAIRWSRRSRRAPPRPPAPPGGGVVALLAGQPRGRDRAPHAALAQRARAAAREASRRSRAVLAAADNAAYASFEELLAVALAVTGATRAFGARGVGRRRRRPPSRRERRCSKRRCSKCRRSRSTCSPTRKRRSRGASTAGPTSRCRIWCSTKPVVPELLQEAATPRALADALEALLADPCAQLSELRRLRDVARPARYARALRAVRAELGRPMIRIYHTSDLHDRRHIAAPLRASARRTSRPARRLRRRAARFADGVLPARTDRRRARRGRLRRAARWAIANSTISSARCARGCARMHHPVVCANLVDTCGRAAAVRGRRARCTPPTAKRCASSGCSVPQYPRGSPWERAVRLAVPRSVRGRRGDRAHDAARRDARRALASRLARRPRTRRARRRGSI